jgi:hypothetical protein
VISVAHPLKARIYGSGGFPRPRILNVIGYRGNGPEHPNETFRVPAGRWRASTCSGVRSVVGMYERTTYEPPTCNAVIPTSSIPGGASSVVSRRTWPFQTRSTINDTVYRSISKLTTLPLKASVAVGNMSERRALFALCTVTHSAFTSAGIAAATMAAARAMAIRGECGRTTQLSANPDASGGRGARKAGNVRETKGSNSSKVARSNSQVWRPDISRPAAH